MRRRRRRPRGRERENLAFRWKAGEFDPDRVRDVMDAETAGPRRGNRRRRKR